MKLIIFLLLLSANCLGQKTPRGTDSIVTELYNSPLTIHGEDSVRVFKNGIATWTTMQCSHKWVELHQDTVVSVIEVGERGLNGMIIHPIGVIENTNERYEYSIPLICLICHQEKKKVIHYKRDK